MDQLKPLLYPPPPKDFKSLRTVKEMFSHYLKWVRIRRFSDKIHNIILCKSLHIPPSAVGNFESLKLDIANSVISSINSDNPLIVEWCHILCISSNTWLEWAPYSFFSRSLTNIVKEKQPYIEKKLTYATVEVLKKLRYFLIGKHFKLIARSRSLIFYV